MLRRFLFAVSLLVPLLAPAVVLAAPVDSFLPIVQCGGTDSSGVPQNPCTPCDLFKAVDNVANFILQGVTGPVAAFMFVIGGGMMLLGAGNANLQAQAKRLLTNTAIGVVIILLAWVFTNFIIKAVAGGSTTDAWYQFSCPSFLSTIPGNTNGAAPGVPVIQPAVQIPQGYNINASTLAGSQLQQIAKDHNNALYPYGNSPQLINLVNCIYRNPVIAALAKPIPVSLSGNARQPNGGGFFTYDNDHPTCNYTRGQPIGAGACSHDPNSCHYGGTSGKGAMAVDINARGGLVDVGAKDKDGKAVPVSADLGTLYCQLYDYLITKRSCGDIKLLNWEPERSHVHISTASCDTDGKTLDTAAASRAANQPIPDCANSFRVPK